MFFSKSTTPENPCPKKTIESMHINAKDLNAIHYFLLDNNIVTSEWYCNDFKTSININSTKDQFIKTITLHSKDGCQICRNILNELSNI